MLRTAQNRVRRRIVYHATLFNNLVYKDFRPIRLGDVGYTERLKLARVYYSPSEQKIISVRQFQRYARGIGQPLFAKRRKRRQHLLYNYLLERETK
jgi:hypothetical protein